MRCTLFLGLFLREPERVDLHAVAEATELFVLDRRRSLQIAPTCA